VSKLLSKYVTEGMIKGTIRRGRRCKKVLDDLKERRRYWNLKEQALDCSPWTKSMTRGYKPVARETI
jgi:hypothetical protein